MPSRALWPPGPRTVCSCRPRLVWLLGVDQKARLTWPGPLRAQVMNKICRESEASLDYYSLFKAIMKRAVVPMSPLESLASSAVRTAHKVAHSLLLHLCLQCPRACS